MLSCVHTSVVQKQQMQLVHAFAICDAFSIGTSCFVVPVLNSSFSLLHTSSVYSTIANGSNTYTEKRTKKHVKQNVLELD